MILLTIKVMIFKLWTFYNHIEISDKNFYWFLNHNFGFISFLFLYKKILRQKTKPKIWCKFSDDFCDDDDDDDDEKETIEREQKVK